MTNDRANDIRKITANLFRAETITSLSPHRPSRDPDKGQLRGLFSDLGSVPDKEDVALFVLAWREQYDAWEAAKKALAEAVGP